MSSSSLKLDFGYVSTELVKSLEAVAIGTKLSGKVSYIQKFSYADAQNSYAFGLFQYNVKESSSAQDFLSVVGFSSNQIARLSHQGGLTTNQLSPLNSQLATALQDPNNSSALQVLNTYRANELASQLQSTLNAVSIASPDVANQIYQSSTLQLQLLDYANQFHLTSTSSMARWLSNCVGVGGDGIIFNISEINP